MTETIINQNRKEPTIMPEGTYTMLKPTNGIPHFQSNNTGAHYSVVL